MKKIIFWAILFCPLPLVAEKLELERYNVPLAELRAISPDGRYIALYSLADTSGIKILEVRTGAFLNAFETLIPDFRSSVAFSADSKQILVGGTTGTLEAYDLVTAQKASEATISFGIPISAIAVSGDPSSQILFISTPNGPSVWSYPGMYRIHSFGPPVDAASVPSDKILESRKRFTSAVRLDGFYAVEGDITLGQIRLFDLQKMQEVLDGSRALARLCGSIEKRSSLDVDICAPSSFVRVGLTSADSISALTLADGSELVWEEFNFQGSVIARHPLGYIIHAPNETHAISEDGSRILMQFAQIGTYPEVIRADEHCAALIRDIRVSPEPEFLSVPVGTRCHGTVLLSRDGKTGITLTDDDVLRVWSLP